MSPSIESSGRPWPSALPLLVLLLGGALTGMAAWWQDRHNRTALERSVQASASRLSHEVVQRVQRFELGLVGLRGMALATGWDKLSRETFNRYSDSRDIDREYPGARGIGLIRRVQPDGLRAFERNASADGWPGFSARKLAPHAEESFVIQYVAPVERNRQAVGLDIGSESNRRGAALAALRRGEATLTAPITLVQAAERSRMGFLLLLPVYADGKLPQEAAERIDRALGWTYAPLLIDEILNALTDPGGDLDLRLSDVQDGNKSTFFRAGKDLGAAEVPAMAAVDFPIAGRSWRLEAWPSPAFAAGLNPLEPRTVAVTGICFSVLLALALLSWQRNRQGKRDLLRERERRALALHLSQDAIIIVGTDWTIHDWNRGAEILFGYSAAEAIGNDYTKLLVPPQLLEEANSLQQRLSGAMTLPVYEAQRLHRNGQTIDVSVSLAALRGPDGQFGGAMASMRDIRQAKQAERALQQANAELEHRVAQRTEALDTALRESHSFLNTVRTHAIVSITDRAGTIVDVNDAFCRISQYGRDELVGRNHRIVSSGRHDAAFWRDMWGTISLGQPWRGEICNRARDGSLYWVDSMVAPIPSADGSIKNYISIRFDVTARVLAQERLSEVVATLQAVLDASSEVSIVATCNSGQVRVFNRGAERMLGYKAEDVVAKMRHTDFHDRDEIEQRRQALARTQNPQATAADVFTDPAWIGRPREWTYLRSDGRRIPVSLIITPVFDQNQELTGYLGVALDITQRKEYERQLEQATAKAEAANQAKSEFLANMSHEIRSPLNAVVGLTYLLSQSPLDQEQQNYLKRIKVASDALLINVNDVLDIAKVEAGGLMLENAPFALGATLADLVAVMSVNAQAKGVPVDLSLAPDLPARVMGDSARVSQVINNLLSNAIKFTQRGWVRVRLDWRSLAPGRGMAHLVVADSGEGMDEQTAQRVFEPFVQADTSTTRRYGGTGLGLSIVKRLVELMGGRLGVTSQPGVGSEFWVDLPFDVADPEQLTTSQELMLRRDALRDRTILVVDDSDINRDVARRILERKGARVVLAEDGLQALARVRDQGDAIDLVLMDIHMPVMDGFEATRRIRNELGRANLPILALTGGATVGERESALAAGVDDFMTKPFDPTKLLRGIVQRLNIADALEAKPSAMPVSEPAWPAIPGVDVREARERLSHDLTLFLTMLRRLFTSQTSIEIGPDPLDEAQLRTAVHEVHKLRGNAGTLGMKELHRLSTEVENALRGDQVARARALVPELNSEFARLRQAWAAMGQATSVEADAQAKTPVNAALEGLDLSELLVLLRNHNMRATEVFEQLAPKLRLRLSSEIYRQVVSHIEDLQFAAATKLLDQAIGHVT